MQCLHWELRFHEHFSGLLACVQFKHKTDIDIHEVLTVEDEVSAPLGSGLLVDPC